jgi:tetratricopeptide (TPR) repeat protein
MRTSPVLYACIALAGCAGSSAAPPAPTLPIGVEAFSLLGDTLRPLPLSAAVRARYETQLDSARRAVTANSADPEALIWLGRRTAYLGRYREAIGIFTRGIGRFPADARFYRHRGHRWISVREFDRAVRDFARAAELVRGQADVVEPDGLPNARGIPTSTLQTNIWYHLGLAYYLRGDNERARQAWDSCLALSKNPDMEVATRYWLALVTQRLGSPRDTVLAILAPVTRRMAIIENTSYHRLLLVFKGILPFDSVMNDEGVAGATTNYGLAAWMLGANLDGTAPGQAQAEYFLRRARSENQWPAFGYVAAEADLARLTRGR